MLGLVPVSESLSRRLDNNFFAALTLDSQKIHV